LIAVSYVIKQLSKDVPWHTSVHRVIVGVPQDLGCNFISDKGKYMNNV
jgi:hypothetical protein